MSFDFSQLVVIAPEISMLVLACLTLLAGLFIGRCISDISYYIAQLALVVAFALNVSLFGQQYIVFTGSFISDNFSVLLKLVIYVTTFATFFYSRQYIKERNFPQTEFYTLGLLSVLGMMVLVSSYHLITVFLGLELMSLPLYTMVAINRDNGVCAEAAMKYFVVGALATGMMLFGMSLIYGATGSLDIVSIAGVIAKMSMAAEPMLAVGLVFIVVALAFKLGAVPFHMWVPDVYQGAPAPVVLFIGSAAKVASFAMVIRLLINALPALQQHWTEILVIIAVLSMAVGNIAAIMQTNLKRLLAYSSIAQMGYLLLGIIAASSDGFATATFYMLTYALTTLAAFGFIVLLSRNGIELEAIEDLKGLNSRNPWLAFMMMMVMFSLAGIPPLVGFIAKLMVLQALVAAGYIWLAAVALLFAVVGAYYYIRVVKVMYFEESVDTAIATPMSQHVMLSINTLALLGLGLFPVYLVDLCRVAFA